MRRIRAVRVDPPARRQQQTQANKTRQTLCKPFRHQHQQQQKYHRLRTKHGGAVSRPERALYYIINSITTKAKFKPRHYAFHFQHQYSNVTSRPARTTQKTRLFCFCVLSTKLSLSLSMRFPPISFPSRYRFVAKAFIVLPFFNNTPFLYIY